MSTIKGIIALTILVSVLQVCTGNAIAVGEETDDVTKMFTADELERARNAGIRDRELKKVKVLNVTVDEMIQLYELQKSEPARYDMVNDSLPTITFEQATKLCEIFVPHHKTVGNYSSDQELRLTELMDSIDHLPRTHLFLYLRSGVCAYITEPVKYDTDANAFGLKLVPYMEFRFWRMKNQHATGVERVDAAKVLCCIYKGRVDITDLKVQSTEFGLSDEKMTEFAKHWNEFETANTSKSFEQVCNFLRVTNPSEEC